jgi:crotonobetainyl-CoA:carnitine CoA-transferase CaiB-like acyl-CoA transferase
MGLPLDGLLVVSVEQAVAAPFATRHLADLGARVIKVERPDGGDFARDYDHVVRGLSSHFVWLNRGKESLALDLTQKTSKDVMRRLLGRADVFVQNLAPGAADRLQLGAETVRSLNPRLIVCSISGYGGDGPYRDQRAYDLLVQAEAGVISTTGSEAEPAKVGPSIADIGAGMYAFAGILAALLDRERTGQGTVIEVSLFDALVEWLGFHLTFTEHAGYQPPRSGSRHATIEPYGPFAVRDGTVFLGAQTEREWRSLCVEVLREPALADDPRFRDFEARRRHRVELKETIERLLADRAEAEVRKALDTARIPTARFNTLQDLLQHPHLEQRGRWRRVETAAGTIRATLPAIVWKDRQLAMRRVPELGEHSASILAELGL